MIVFAEFNQNRPQTESEQTDLLLPLIKTSTLLGKYRACNSGHVFSGSRVAKQPTSEKLNRMLKKGGEGD